MHRSRCRRRDNQAALQELVSDLMTTPLDRSKPLWHIYLIEDYGEGPHCSCACTTASPTGSRSRA